MPVLVKSAATRVLGERAAKRKSAHHSHTVTKVFAGGGKCKPVSAARIRSEIDKVARQLKADIIRIRSTRDARPLDYHLIVEEDRVRLDSAPVRSVRLNPVTRKGAAAFDPEDAGRKVVVQMQASEGGAWTGQELAERFHLSPAALHKRRKEFRIVSWRDAKHEFHYPKWQFTPTGALLTGVKEVLQTFRSSDEWRVMRYFLAPRRQLDDQTPLDLLRAGDVGRVVGHAKAHGEENTW